MPVSILVATPHTAFGELLRLSLEDNKQYQVQLVFSGQQLRKSAAQNSYQLAILDADLIDEPFVPLCYDLLDRQKGIRLVVIPPENDPNHPALGGLMPHGYLNRPFYLPDLMETVARLLGQRASEAKKTHEPESATLPPWLQDPMMLQAYLEKELKPSLALAGFVGLVGPQRGEGELRAKTGRLNDPAAQELAGVVFRYWNRDEKTDLMRFMRLSVDKDDYLVYATQITGDLILMLVYNTDAPLSQIRPQTKSLAQALASVPPESFQDSRSQQAGQPLLGDDKKHQEAPDIVESGETALATARAANEPDTQPMNEPALTGHKRYTSTLHPDEEFPPLADESVIHGVNVTGGQVDKEALEDEDEQVVFKLSALLGSVPAPDPSPIHPAKPLSGGWEPAESSQDSPGPESFETPPDSSTNTQNVQVNPAFPTKEPERDLDRLEDTRPRVISAINSINQLEPVSPALAMLNYTCVLVPRLPQHYLAGELADQLSSWVQQLCLAYGWRLEGIAVRPDYIQWTVQVNPAISPGNLVRIIRQRTSQLIFSRFQHFQELNPSGDFWAVGYLIVSGAQPPSAQLLRDYIGQTRKRQGVVK